MGVVGLHAEAALGLPACAAAVLSTSADGKASSHWQTTQAPATRARHRLAAPRAGEPALTSMSSGPMRCRSSSALGRHWAQATRCERGRWQRAPTNTKEMHTCAHCHPPTHARTRKTCTHTHTHTHTHLGTRPKKPSATASIWRSTLPTIMQRARCSTYARLDASFSCGAASMVVRRVGQMGA